MQDFTNTYNNSAANGYRRQRASFIRKTYLLVAAAILAFIVVEAFLFASGAAYTIASLIFSGGSIGWLAVLALFMGVSISLTAGQCPKPRRSFLTSDSRST